ncbi:MAG TPA: hypothetical protein VGS19_33120 [Streptosporangiaceae bacterium]|nr:hypothetical protein [Streptosporangiaceae bacterium]
MRRGVIVLAATVLGVVMAVAPAAVAQAAVRAAPARAAAQGGGRSDGRGGPAPSTGNPWQMPAQPPPDPGLAQVGSGAVGSSEAAVVKAAPAKAHATRRPVVVAGLTTETGTVTAEPDGREVGTEYVLPVRVRRGDRWVTVDTRLRRGAGGRWAPAAVPGDVVSFSRGGEGPVSVVSALGSRLALSWLGGLPAPVISGASATYHSVLPEVDLVLTATSAAAGGFSEVLVVHSRNAVHDRGLARLAMGVAAPGTAGLHVVAGGGLVAAMASGRGSFVGAAPSMWDSSAEPRSAAGVQAAAAAARAVGAGLAPMGSGAVSGVDGPAGGARLAPVMTHVVGGGRVWSLVPDERMLTSPTTRFPVYVKAGSFVTVSGTGKEQAYDPVQSDPGGGPPPNNVDCRGSHYNDSSYKSSPVGYDNFKGGSCQFNDTDYALFQVGVPTGVFDPHAKLISATFNLTEVYTSTCATTPVSLTVSWTGAINHNTGWSGPNPTRNNVDKARTLGPDPGSCGSTENFSHTRSKGWDISADLKAFPSSANNITLRVWEPKNNNDADHKQLANNPDLQVVWTDTPDVPSNLGEAATSQGTGSVDCATSPANPPAIGATDANLGVYLMAQYADEDNGSVSADIRYWNYTSNGPVTSECFPSWHDLFVTA